MKTKKILMLTAALLLLLLGATVLYQHLAESNPADRITDQKPEEGSTGEQESISAPGFTVYDFDGNEVKLSDFLGKPVVLNFWASWCPPCKSEMPDFEEAWSELGEDVQFMMVNLTDGSRETVETAADYIAQEDFGFPVFYDSDSSAAQAYGVYSIPASFFIDAEGNAIARASGAIDRDTLQKGIDMILPEQE